MMVAEFHNLGNPLPLNQNPSPVTVIDEGVIGSVNSADTAIESFREGESQKFHTLLFPHHGRRHRRPRISSNIQEAILASRRILELPDNWDENDSPGYAEETWILATTFVKRVAVEYWLHKHVWVNPPRILPGPEASIDIHWQTRNRELLINIPASSDTPAGYYGSGGADDNIKGKLKVSLSNEWVLAWLLR